jgi:hypothetical protein
VGEMVDKTIQAKRGKGERPNQTLDINMFTNKEKQPVQKNKNK